MKNRKPGRPPKEGEPKKRLSVNVDPELAEAIAQVSRKRDQSISSLMNEAGWAWLKEEESKIYRIHKKVDE